MLGFERVIKKVPGGYKLFTKDGKRPLDKHPVTKQEAIKQEIAIKEAQAKGK